MMEKMQDGEKWETDEHKRTGDGGDGELMDGRWTACVDGEREPLKGSLAENIMDAQETSGGEATGQR